MLNTEIKYIISQIKQFNLEKLVILSRKKKNCKLLKCSKANHKTLTVDKLVKRLYYYLHFKEYVYFITVFIQYL